MMEPVGNEIKLEFGEVMDFDDDFFDGEGEFWLKGCITLRVALRRICADLEQDSSGCEMK
jgi:hypothetical protein